MLNDNVLVVGIQPEMRKGVVIGVTTDDKPQEGRVLKVGPGKILENGERVEPGVRPGMQVLFNEHTTTKFNIGGKLYYCLREEDIVAFE